MASAECRWPQEQPEAPFHDLSYLSLQIFKLGTFQMGKLRLGEMRSRAHIRTLHAVGAVWFCSLDSTTVTATFLSYLPDKVVSEAA